MRCEWCGAELPGPPGPWARGPAGTSGNGMALLKLFFFYIYFLLCVTTNLDTSIPVATNMDRREY
jgi:hypothetical protein